MIDERFPNWLIDVEKGTVYSLISNRYIGTKLSSGHINVTQKKDGIVKIYGVHRLIWMVANQAEIPEGYDVHHIDHNPLNNSIYNLELIEHKKHISKHKKGINHTSDTKNKLSESHKGKMLSEETKLKISLSLQKQVAQYTLDDELIKIWDSAKDTEINGYIKSCVTRCCNGERKQHKGYIWKYYNEERDVA